MLQVFVHTLSVVLPSNKVRGSQDILDRRYTRLKHANMGLLPDAALHSAMQIIRPNFHFSLADFEPFHICSGTGTATSHTSAEVGLYHTCCPESLR